MSKTISNGNQAVVTKGRWLKRLKKGIIPLLTLFLVIAITTSLFLYRDKVAELRNYGYLGVFLIALVSNATIVLPMPGFLVLFSLGAVFNPFLVGLSGALGGTTGEITGYLLGYSGRGVIENRRLYDQAVSWLKRWGGWAIFIFALTPSPFDVIGMVAGLLRFPFWQFFLACFLGKSLKYSGIAVAGAWGWEAVLRYFS